MFTSCFANVKQIPSDLVPVAISRGIPRFYKGRRELSLAPTRAMLAMPLDELVEMFKQRLAKLDPEKIAAKLGDNAVLLCWERPGVKCHRRIVADFFADQLGLCVDELGLGPLPRFDKLPDAR